MPFAALRFVFIGMKFPDQRPVDAAWLDLLPILGQFCAASLPSFFEPKRPETRPGLQSVPRDM